MRHTLGVLGVLAAGVLLAVSAAMNWRFGYQLGKTELDGIIYGSASAAADCLKALVPFFFFAAVKNRMWSQAAAAALVGVVVTAYSLTSALGHAALNRLDTTGQRAVDAQHYKDLRGDLKRAQDQLSWVPQHRPAQTVQADIDNAKNQRAWTFTKGCSEVTGKTGRDFCNQYNGWTAELASAQQSQVLETRIAEVQEKLGKSTAGNVMAEADPQAAVLAKLSGVDIDKIQMALTIFVALLLEVGSGFGMYVAFSQWRLYDSHAPAAPKMAQVGTAAAAVTAAPITVVREKPRSGANDNKSAPAPRLMAPETDVERFYKEMVENEDGSTISATALYEEYCVWCEDRKKEPLAHPTFGRDFQELGVQKAKIGGRVRYIGIKLKSGKELEEDKKLPAFSSQAA